MPDTPTRLTVETTHSPTAQPRHSEGWGSFDMLRREVDRLFDDFLPSRWRPSLLGAETGTTIAWPLAPAAELSERDGSFTVTVELPGIDPAAISVKVSDGALVIKGEKTQDESAEKADYFIRERHYGAFQRSFSIPHSVDTAGIEASFANGVLTVTLPKSAAAKANEKSIEVKAA